MTHAATNASTRHPPETPRSPTADLLADRPQVAETVRFPVDEHATRLLRLALRRFAAGEDPTPGQAATARAFRSYFGTALERLRGDDCAYVTMSIDAADVALIVRATVEAAADHEDERTARQLETAATELLEALCRHVPGALATLASSDR